MGDTRQGDQQERPHSGLVIHIPSQEIHLPCVLSMNGCGIAEVPFCPPIYGKRHPRRDAPDGGCPRYPLADGRNEHVLPGRPWRPQAWAAELRLPFTNPRATSSLASSITRAFTSSSSYDTCIVLLVKVTVRIFRSSAKCEINRYEYSIECHYHACAMAPDIPFPM